MEPRALLLYDGTCALCDGTVRFLLRIDRRGRIDFAPLDGPTAEALRARNPWLREIDSVALVRGPGTAAESVRSRSDAILSSLAIVGGVWKLSAILRLVPRPLRDWVYDRVAARRKRWFGELAACPIPAPQHRRRFLP